MRSRVKNSVVFVITFVVVLGVIGFLCNGSSSCGLLNGGNTSFEIAKSTDSIVGRWINDRVEISGYEVDAAQRGITDGMYKFTFKDDGTAVFVVGDESATASYEVGSDGKIILDGDSARSESLGLTYSNGELSLDKGWGKVIFKKV